MPNTGYNGEPWFSYLPRVNQMAKFKDKFWVPQYQL